jgi:hypothetical protein
MGILMSYPLRQQPCFMGNRKLLLEFRKLGQLVKQLLEYK